jgi:hypothetical protein
MTTDACETGGSSTACLLQNATNRYAGVANFTPLAVTGDLTGDDPGSTAYDIHKALAWAKANTEDTEQADKIDQLMSLVESDLIRVYTRPIADYMVVLADFAGLPDFTEAALPSPSDIIAAEQTNSSFSTDSANAQQHQQEIAAVMATRSAPHQIPSTALAPAPSLPAANLISAWGGLPLWAKITIPLLTALGGAFAYRKLSKRRVSAA